MPLRIDHRVRERRFLEFVALQLAHDPTSEVLPSEVGRELDFDPLEVVLCVTFLFSRKLARFRDDVVTDPHDDWPLRLTRAGYEWIAGG